jgi:hypothetical protein
MVSKPEMTSHSLPSKAILYAELQEWHPDAVHFQKSTCHIPVRVEGWLQLLSIESGIAREQEQRETPKDPSPIIVLSRRADGLTKAHRSGAICFTLCPSIHGPCQTESTCHP